MTKMIPPEPTISTESPGERRVFDLLRLDPDTNGWVALHSLGLSNRGQKPFGEIDFVVLIPDIGVLCVEVKGGQVSCQDGIWRNRSGPLNRSPFMQSREGMFSLRAAVEKKFGNGSAEHRCPFGYAVVFTDVDCPPVTPEFNRSDAIDRGDLRQPISRVLLKTCRQQVAMANAPTPSTETLSHIRNFLRPNFDLVISRGATISQSEERIIQLTEEQYRRLDELDENPRCLFDGAAGTGKTMLAIEYARRAALADKRTLIICFNRLLGRWFASESAIAAKPNVVAGSFHNVLRDTILRSSFASEFGQAERQGSAAHFFNETIPLFGEMAIEDLRQKFECVVVDEAQDLLRPAILNVIDAWTIGGLAGGRWAMFGDFTRQALFGAPAEGFRELETRCPYFTRARLKQNCRNTRRVASETAFLSGFEELPYSLATSEGLPVAYHYWKSVSDQVDLINAAVSKLLASGVKTKDIVLLGTRRYENSALSQKKDICGHRVRVLNDGPTDAARANDLAYSTAHAFKGLESPVVLIVDVDDVDPEECQSLLYVAMSRAKSHLIMFVAEQARHSVEEKVRHAMIRELGR